MTGRRAALLALPGVALALAGLLHPMHLNHATALRWWTLHVAGLFVFPLVGVALAAAIGPPRGPLELLGLVAAYVYATAYTTLDVVNGIAAGYLTWRLPAGAPRPREVSWLFRLGDPFGGYGADALVVAALALTAVAVRRSGPRGLVGLLAVAGGALVRQFHIFVPWGALGILLVGLGTALAAGIPRREGD